MVVFLSISSRPLEWGQGSMPQEGRLRFSPCAVHNLGLGGVVGPAPSISWACGVADSLANSLSTNTFSCCCFYCWPYSPLRGRGDGGVMADILANSLSTVSSSAAAAAAPARPPPWCAMYSSAAAVSPVCADAPVVAASLVPALGAAPGPICLHADFFS